MPVHLVDDASFEAFRSQRGTVLVDFWAEWCPPCKRMDPILEQVAAELPGVRVGRVDVDRSQATAAREGVLGMPTFMVYRDGRKVAQVVGAVPKSTLLAALKG